MQDARSYGALCLVVWNMYQDGEPTGSFNECPKRRSITESNDKISLPMALLLSITHFLAALVDRAHGSMRIVGNAGQCGAAFDVRKDRSVLTSSTSEKGRLRLVDSALDRSSQRGPFEQDLAKKPV